jgi:hypothetical protein
MPYLHLLNRHLLIVAAVATLLAASAGIAAAETPPPNPTQLSSEKSAADKTWLWHVKTGYRRDDLDWSIAGFTPTTDLNPPLQGNFVNILSELTWRDVEIFQLALDLEKRIQDRYRVFGQLSIGMIFDGNVQDSDYAGNNRTFEFSRAVASTDDGDTWDLYLGFGYEFSFFSDILSLSPLVGLSYHGQNLRLTDGFQAVSDFGWENRVSVGPFPFLDSTYEASWFGPWIGLEVAFNLLPDMQGRPIHALLLGGEVHLADYYADANWNLRGDLQHPKSFEHEADGLGWLVKLDYRYFFRPQWHFSAEGKYQKWTTDPGVDRIFFSDGTIAETPLNEVTWESFAIVVGVGMSF